ncbi:DUF4830 domain-containing protein [Paenibacillus sp. HJL G12]|uniref:DUF4830 domain-containing protein n=1 Tax=Paenibacillus dendrobii TaxID=2691084 RepID=A0A7X3LFR9_9BACL|nr:DUF4830 domain-containing protein [Paenibacillus dendrobii]MWV43312.1 DUF4830 domain-containing protein [Paenibacillus dendrobii]
MKAKWAFLILILLVVVTGCNNDTSEQVITYNKDHTRYLERYGWNIDRFASEMKYAPETLISYGKHMKEVKTAGQLDLSPYVHQEVIETGYLLHETTPGYNRITAYILESGGHIIGSYLMFEHELQDEHGAYHTDYTSTEPMVHSSKVVPQDPTKK